jgi:hypothetical protein
MSRIVPVGEIVLLVLAPTLAFGAIAFLPRWLRSARRVIDARRAESYPQPIGPPIERIAADLRRLLWEHDRLSWSSDFPFRVDRVWALEAAIGYCAGQAARALGLPSSDPPARGGLHGPELHRLLRALTGEGLVLPTAVVLLRSDDRS